MLTPANLTTENFTSDRTNESETVKQLRSWVNHFEQSESEGDALQEAIERAVCEATGFAYGELAPLRESGVIKSDELIATLTAEQCNDIWHACLAECPLTYDPEAKFLA